MQPTQQTYILSPDIIFNFPNIILNNSSLEESTVDFSTANIVIPLYAITTLNSASNTKQGQLARSILSYLRTLFEKEGHIKNDSNGYSIEKEISLNNDGQTLSIRSMKYPPKELIPGEGGYNQILNIALEVIRDRGDYYKNNEGNQEKDFKNAPVTLLTNDNALAILASICNIKSSHYSYKKQKKKQKNPPLADITSSN